VREQLTAFVQHLRASGVRISVAETLDAMHAVKLAGVEPEVVREALSATLIKDETDRELFLEIFGEYFAAPPLDVEGGRARKRKRLGATGAPSDGGSRAGARRPGAAPATAAARSAVPKPPAPPSVVSAAPPWRRGAPEPRDPRREAALDAESTSQAEGTSRAEPSTTPASRQRSARVRAVATRPFHEMSEREVIEAREVARELGRRLKARSSRREEAARRGRADFRRTIRGSLARGGAMLDVKYRGRRPGRPHLIALCDVSWSVSLASEMLLGILGAAEAAFRRVTRFAFVDRLVPIAFEGGHIAPEAPLDLHARSDHGAVLCQLESQHAVRVDRSTVLLVLADARSNRRPPRADALRRMAQRARGVIWAVPEPCSRWNTGDSSLAAYAPFCDVVVEATTLQGLVRALRHAER
jgi:hypothetical protein